MSRLTAVVLGATIAGSLVACAHVGPQTTNVTAGKYEPHAVMSSAPKPVMDIARRSPSPSPSRRASRSRQLPGAEAWASTPFARRVAQCESSDDPTILDSHTGTTYFGKWQANADFVRSYDGSNAWSWVVAGRFTMPEAQQDEMAYRGWLARGWQPWECAGLVSR